MPGHRKPAVDRLVVRVLIVAAPEALCMVEGGSARGIRDRTRPVVDPPVMIPVMVGRHTGCFLVPLGITTVSFKA